VKGPIPTGRATCWRPWKTFIRRYAPPNERASFWRAERALDVLRRQTEPRWS